LCRDLSELGKFAMVSTPHYRLLKINTPGAYSFILPATAEVPRRFYHPKRKTIGMRVPDNTVCQALLTVLNEPLLSVTLILPDHPEPLTDAEQINDALGKQLDFIIGGTTTGTEPTTVVDLTETTPQILRVGKGNPAPFEI
jgi:tRNA threonylcarbamoyl adenosine modification protein (Sua5/YciO/YrdC/YwlC family)